MGMIVSIALSVSVFHIGSTWFHCLVSLIFTSWLAINFSLELHNCYCGLVLQVVDDLELLIWCQKNRHCSCILKADCYIFLAMLGDVDLKSFFIYLIP